MLAITRFWGAYFINNYIVNADSDKDIDSEEINYTHLSQSIKSKFIASFGKDDNFNFYWINYNNNNVYDFEMGGHFDYQQITTENFKSIKIEKFTNSPFVFFEKMTIVDLKFIFAKQFAYYKLKEVQDKYYYGIIDVPKNRVIFHTDEEITQFIPYSDIAMLAITKNSAYKICVSRNEDDCEVCNNNKFMLDSSKYNFCGNNCNAKYILIPHNICSDTCDERVFSIKDNKCGLCKDFGDDNVYKFYNRPGCFNNKPENSFYVNEENKIIDCKNDYKFYKGKCFKCHDFCEICSMESNDINNQNCISCKNRDFFLQEGNCVEKCSNNYFLNDKNCIKCDNSCENCDKASNNCTNCIDGKFLDKSAETHSCKDCTNNCKTCQFFEDNCITCDQTSSFKYFFNSSCYDNCPKDTIQNDTIYICEEIKNQNKDNEIDNNEDKHGDSENDGADNNSQSDKVMLSIFTIITAALLFLTLFCFFKKICCLNKQAADNLLDDINTELRDN